MKKRSLEDLILAVFLAISWLFILIPILYFIDLLENFFATSGLVSYFWPLYFITLVLYNGGILYYYKILPKKNNKELKTLAKQKKQITSKKIKFLKLVLIIITILIGLQFFGILLQALFGFFYLFLGDFGKYFFVYIFIFTLIYFTIFILILIRIIKYRNYKYVLLVLSLILGLIFFYYYWTGKCEDKYYMQMDLYRAENNGQIPLKTGGYSITADGVNIEKEYQACVKKVGIVIHDPD